MAPIDGMVYGVRPNLNQHGVLTFHPIDRRRWRPVYAKALHHTLPGQPVVLDRARIHYLRGPLSRVRSGKSTKCPCIAVIGVLQSVGDVSRMPPVSKWTHPDHVRCIVDPHDPNCYPVAGGFGAFTGKRVIMRLGDDVVLWKSKIWHHRVAADGSS